MNDSDQLRRQALDASRAGTDDRSTPELLDLARAVESSAEWRDAQRVVQRADEQIDRALRLVEIPAGLEERLLAACAAAERAEHAEPNPAPEQSVSAGLFAAATPAATARVPDRRRWLAWGAGLAVMLVLAAWGVSQWQRVPPWQTDHLGFEAIAWSQQLSDDWLDLQDADSRQRPFTRQVRYVPRGWQPVKTGHDATALAYDLTRSRGTATLFVLSPATIPAEVPTVATRIPATGGWGAAAWQSGSCVYVLLVEERRQKLEDFLPAASRIVRVGSPAGRRPAMRIS